MKLNIKLNNHFYTGLGIVTFDRGPKVIANFTRLSEEGAVLRVEDGWHNIYDAQGNPTSIAGDTTLCTLEGARKIIQVDELPRNVKFPDGVEWIKP